MQGIGRAAGEAHDPSSGAQVALAFQKLLSLIFLIAWVSLGAQLQLLIGSRGLLPFARFREQLLEQGFGFSQFPSLLLYAPSDAAITALWIAGSSLALCSLFGIWPRLTFGLNTLLYLSCTVAGQSFLSFQWDNLLLECGLLAIFLRADRRQTWVHFLFRVLLFKLYFESGIAKYQSDIGDWRDGSAMAHYYETAPIPTVLAWFMHHLPIGWHRVESWLTLIWEIGVPFLIFGPRVTRLTALAIFTLFQTINLLTANYGFFCYLALCLSVFLLSDRDIERWRCKAHRAAVRRRRRLVERGYALRRWAARYRLFGRTRRHLLQRLTIRIPSAWRPVDYGQRAAIALVVLAYFCISLDGALLAFWPAQAPLGALVQEARGLYAPLRLINCYHLFGQITTERIEPEFQVFSEGNFRSLALRYKPGPVTRAPPFVSPHQPRVDFQLWFYGLSARRGTPTYVVNLLQRLCHDPEAVESLFTGHLPQNPEAARVVFYDYHFTSFDEWRQTGAWWRRELVDEPRTLPCKRR